MTVKAWGYNGSTPGPTLEWVQGDRIRILVTNTLPEATVVHWHGLLIPGASGMDGVQGLTQKGIAPGETYFYEFTVKQEPGTLMYHSHGDEMVQIGMGSYGFVIIHPKNPRSRRVDRDFAIFLNEWSVTPGTSTPDTSVMTDFNLFTFNSRIYPSTDPLIAKTGEKIRIRIASVSQDLHPIHLHGHTFSVTGTDGGPVPPTARWPETTVVVAPGQTRDVEFRAVAGDWAFHCHRRHHPMNAMGHDVPNMLGVSQAGVEDQIKELVPGYMAMGETGMGEMADMHMPLPKNTMPMMGGEGPFGAIGMGGMFTVLKVRDRMKSYTDAEAGWFENPAGTVSEPWPVPSE
jgi:FtsP/CotA-like multicopper oxidase with cupredoxin domain